MRLLLLALTVLVAALPATAQYEVTLVADVNPSNSSYPKGLAVYGEQLFFSADDGLHGYELWSYNPSTNEASLATDLCSCIFGSNPEHLTTYDGRLYFRAIGIETGAELWAFDATTSATTLVVDVWPGTNTLDNPYSSDPANLIVHDDRLFFTADDGEHGVELWVYDVTTQNASLIADINPGDSPSLPQYLRIYDSRLFFRAGGASGTDIYAYDSATDEVTPVGGYAPDQLIVYDDRLFFADYTVENGRELWAFDADTGEISLEADIYLGSGSSLPSDFAVYDGRLFFSASDEANGRGLWAYDAELDEAYLVADVSPSALTVYDGRLFFIQGGHELWFYETNTEEITLAAEIDPNGGGYDFRHLTVYDGRLFFSADDGTHGRELWALVPTSVANEPTVIPQPARLHTPHPNPAQDRATVSFDVDDPGPVRIEVLDVLGRRVALLADGPVRAGEHSLTWEADTLPSGVYFVRLTAGDAVQTQRLTLVR